LSPELTRNFKLIYELDLRVQNASVEIDKLKADFFANFKTMDNESRMAQIKLIDRKYDKVKQLSEEKVQLANQTYEMVSFFTNVEERKKNQIIEI
jgi:inhibitor of growth protein 4